VAGGGVADPAGVAALAGATGWPVLADPRSGCRVPGAATVATFDSLLRHEGFAADHRPDVVVRLGSPPASRLLSEWLAGLDAFQVGVERSGTWFDPDRVLDLLVAAEPGAWCRRAADGREPSSTEPGWGERWARAERAAQAAIDAVLGDRGELTEPGVARRVLDRLPEGATLLVGSSMPVRDLEWYASPRDGVRVVSNRGANGIDGVVSTAVGVALADRAPTAVLVGDVSFLHDANALLGLAGRDVALTVVVVDNRGGGIFSFLPQASLVDPDRFELLFGTPHEVDLVALARLHGLEAAQVRTAHDLNLALEGAGRPGARVVVARTDRDANVAVHREINAAVAAAL
jgi:2-succinyl-5-enolpyruvyl-6-hydroxy-3-cyclohexene-1-carboxylate synthase